MVAANRAVRLNANLVTIGILLLSSGCASLGEKGLFPKNGLWPPAIGQDEAKAPLEWDWATGIPRDVQRAELVSTFLPADAVAHFAPEAYQSHVRLASTTHAPTFQIVEIDGRPTKNLKQLHAAVEEARQTPGQVSVGIRGAADSREVPGVVVELPHRTLVSLSQAVAGEHSIVRVTEDGNPWILVRQEGIRGRIMVRAERQRGLLQVVGAFEVCWGQQRVLPLEVRAFCDGQPLACLTVDQTLETLYLDSQADRADETDYSFATVADCDEYLIPTSFKRLHKQIQERSRVGVVLPPLPALATVQGTTYPGPAVLGDARALTAFLMQPQVYDVGDPEQTGWILFGGRELQDGGTVELVVDLGSGPLRFEFTVPEE